MTFPEFATTKGLLDGSAAHNLARDAWDAALCEIQRQAFDEHGKPRSTVEITAAMSRAHSWGEDAQTQTAAVA
jgi:hypothetical protein